MTPILRLAFISVILSLAAPAHASDERMVGRIPVSVPKTDAEKKPVPPRQNDERMAGSKKKEAVAGPQPVKKKPAVKEPLEPKVQETKKPEEPKAPKTAKTNLPAEVTGETAQPEAGKKQAELESEPIAPSASTPKPRFGATMDRKAMESLGPLVNPLKGGLGSDMWDGSSRSTLVKYIPALPSGDTWRPAQLLARRVLLSNGEAGMLNSDTPSSNGQDLFTLRLEKLIDMGAYDDAVNLYTLIEGEPSHDRLGRAGIMALMYGGYPAQACLEARAVHHDLAPANDESKFWDQIESICTFIQVQSAKAVTKAGLIPASLEGFDRSAITGVPASRILTTLASRADYRHSVSSPKDIEELSDIERAVIKGLGRFDYSRLKLKKISDIPAQVLMLMATDKNVPTAQLATLNIEAARRGIITTDMLGDIYLKLAEKSPADDASARIWSRYAALKKATTTAEKKQIISSLLEQKISASSPSLLPFANDTADMNPSGLSPAALQKGLSLILYSGITPPERWLTAWLEAESADSVKNTDSVLLYLANLLPENLPTNSIAFPDESLKTVMTGPESTKSLEIWSLFSGLGRENALHNVASRDVYEKHIDLTLHNDYVMPTEGLIELIRDASNNGRLGEVALLASVALNEYEPGKTHPGVLRDVLQSLVTVGLKEEAQQVALGVVLSFKQ